MSREFIQCGFLYTDLSASIKSQTQTFFSMHFLHEHPPLLAEIVILSLMTASLGFFSLSIFYCGLQTDDRWLIS